MTRRRSDVEVWARDRSSAEAKRKAADTAAWIKRKVAEVIVDVAALDGGRADGALVARLRDLENLLRIPTARRLSADERAARLAAVAGIDQLHAQYAKPTTEEVSDE